MRARSRQGTVIWITGLSGAGKTTVSLALREVLEPRCPELVLLDGDVVRELFGNDLDYNEASRVKQIGRLRTLAKFLAEQGQVVIVAALYSHPDLLAQNRRELPGYFEVYLKTPFEVLRSRDSKGLYADAASGLTSNVVGVDIPWREPIAPDAVLDGGGSLTPRDMALKVIRGALSDHSTLMVGLT